MKDFILACLFGLVMGAGLAYIWLIKTGTPPVWPF